MDSSLVKNLYPKPKFPIYLSSPPTSLLCKLNCVKKLEFLFLLISLTPKIVKSGSWLSFISISTSVNPSPGIKPDAIGVRIRAILDLIPYGEDWRRAGEYLKQVLGDIGIKLELRYEDVPTWLKRIYHNYDFVMNVNYFYQLPDPVLGVHRHYGTDQIRKGTHFVNSSRYSNSELDELLASGATAVSYTHLTLPTNREV